MISEHRRKPKIVGQEEFSQIAALQGPKRSGHCIRMEFSTGSRRVSVVRSGKVLRRFLPTDGVVTVAEDRVEIDAGHAFLFRNLLRPINVTVS